MSDVEASIRAMGFDAEMASDLSELIRISEDAGRKAAIEECAKLVDARADHARLVTGAFSYSGSRKSVIADVMEDIAKDIRGLALPRPEHQPSADPLKPGATP